MKFSLYSKKNQLDEMQEQTMRKIESHGFWLLWGSLLAAWIVQTVFGAADKAAGEWVVFMIGCIYMVVACLRNGLWDRHLSDKAPANAVYSLVAAVAIPQTIAQTRDNHIDTADHEYDPLSGSLVRSPEHRLHDPRRQKAAPQQPEAMAFNFAHGLLLHLVQLVFLAV
jgi:hypothetical protein